MAVFLGSNRISILIQDRITFGIQQLLSFISDVKIQFPIGPKRKRVRPVIVLGIGAGSLSLSMGAFAGAFAAFGVVALLEGGEVGVADDGLLQIGDADGLGRDSG